MIRRAFFGWMAALLVAVPVAQAGGVTVEWDPNSESDLAGYKLYYGTVSRSQGGYTHTVLISDKNATSWGLTLAPNTYYILP